MIALLAPLTVTYAAAAIVPTLARRIRPPHAARLPAAIGIAALIISSALTCRMIAVARSWRRDRGTRAHHLHVVDSEHPVA